MPNRSVMIIKTLQEEKVSGKLPQFAACLVKSKQISPQKLTLLVLRKNKRGVGVGRGRNKSKRKKLTADFYPE